MLRSSTAITCMKTVLDLLATRLLLQCQLCRYKVIPATIATIVNVLPGLQKQVWIYRSFRCRSERQLRPRSSRTCAKRQQNRTVQPPRESCVCVSALACSLFQISHRLSQQLAQRLRRIGTNNLTQILFGPAPHRHGRGQAGAPLRRQAGGATALVGSGADLDPSGFLERPQVAGQGGAVHRRARRQVGDRRAVLEGGVAQQGILVQKEKKIRNSRKAAVCSEYRAFLRSGRFFRFRCRRQIRNDGLAVATGIIHRQPLPVDTSSR